MRQSHCKDFFFPLEALMKFLSLVKGDWQLFSHDHHIDNAHMIILDLPQN